MNVNTVYANTLYDQKALDSRSELDFHVYINRRARKVNYLC